MSYFKKPVNIELLEEAKNYFDMQSEKIKNKFKLLRNFDKTSLGLKGDWFKHLDDGIWEFKSRDHQKFYRLLAFWDRTGMNKH